ncbi:Golgi to ER traffic protein 4 homolog [Pieris napi]|uniref:Golgi to ER traffic protein 4 homolog n=1 Tax=Pieris napi TaxID=78633 RepID=UPI001FB92FEE|nr:Golgi to ER traffic protein 4 homolog [Pieris napi]
MARGERGVGRVLEKLEASVNAGQYYEAHQMYRTLYFRFLNQKKYGDLLQLLHSGASILLECDQQGSGTDLAILLLDVLTKSHIKPCEEWIAKIAQLFSKMKPNVVERETFLINAVKWSMDNNKRGHPLLHKSIAEVYWQENKLTTAYRHFLHSNDGVAFATKLIELHTTKGYKSEIAMFIAQAVLQILCLKNKEMAQEAFKEYTRSHPNLTERVPPFQYPLLNFLYLLLKVIDQKNAMKFLMLRKSYDKFLKRDPRYFGYLDTIARVWFGISAPGNRRNTNSMLSGIIKSMLGDIDSSDEDGSILANKTQVPDLD